jgi:hypothetical protein
MKHILNPLREKFNRSKKFLMYCEDLDLSEETTGSFKVCLEKHKAELRNEIRRVSRLVWPLSGRPKCLK